MNPSDEIFSLVRTFQEGYIHRDADQVDAFMELFTEDAEVIGTNGVRPGVDEWYMDRASARELVAGDWEGWGDVRLDLDAMSVHSRGDVGWIAAPTTVTQVIGEENYQVYLNFIRKYLDTPDLSAEQKLLYILRGGTNTVLRAATRGKVCLGAAVYRRGSARSGWLEIRPDELLLPHHSLPGCALDGIMPEIIDVLLSRRSSRQFTPEPVDQETLVLLLKAAMAAPSFPDLIGESI